MAVANPIEKPWAFKTLQPLPPIAAQLMRLVSSDDASFQRMSSLVRSDSAFSAEVLRLANSPLMGSRRRIDSIRHALTMLGLEKLKSLVMAVALRDFLSSALQVPALRRCWAHSLACACINEALGTQLGFNKDTAYTIGLMHDVGRLALLASYPTEYARMLDVSDEFHYDLLGCENDLFDIDHCKAGEWLVHDWHFPEEFAEVVAHHHEPWTGDKLNLLGLTSCACRIADGAGFSVIASSNEDMASVIEKLPPQVAEKIGDAEEFVAQITDRVKSLESTL